MDGVGVSTNVDFLEMKSESFYPICFGVSCAFVALRVLSPSDEEDGRWSDLCSKMLQGSAHLLGLLVWRIQRKDLSGDAGEILRKLEAAEKEIKELKEIRREEARANERVVGIFASQEQNWLIERRKLQQHIRMVIKELKLMKSTKEQVVSELNCKLKEVQLLLQSKDKVLEETEFKKKELEEKLTQAENTADELRETAKRVAQEHSADLWKHKTAFLELVSNQRKLEAEIGRVLKQLETKNKELDSALLQKDESALLAQKLSLEMVKMQKDLEQKDKLLSAMLRKSNLDMAEKQMLLKEVKISKVKRKQAELEIERWRAVSNSKDSRHERHSLRSMFALHTNSRSDDPSFKRGTPHTGKGRSQMAGCILEFENPEFQIDSDFFPPSERYSTDDNDGLAITANVNQLEGWVQLEAEKYATTIEKRHHQEIDAFVEQMKLKDEKLEAFRWRLLSMEIESKQLQSHIEGRNQEMAELRHENMKLEALLIQTNKELKALKEQLVVQIKPQLIQKSSADPSLHDPALLHENISSKVKLADTITGECALETMTNVIKTHQSKNIVEKVKDCDSPSKSSSVVPSPENVFGEDRNKPGQGYCHETRSRIEVTDSVEKLASPSQPSSTDTSNSVTWRMDLHALGVMYKIKRLSQQLLMLERLMGKHETCEELENNGATQNGTRGFPQLMSLLNKQLSRYQSLQAKTDELCKRMHANYEISHEDPGIGKPKRETKTLEQFLEETFQLQRYMVATGQKLIDVQTKLASGLDGISEELEKSVNFDSKRFTECMRSLFQDVQRGLEVRIARIIGDLEGTLACEGMIRMRR